MDFMFLSDAAGAAGGLCPGLKGLCMRGSWVPCLLFIYVKVTMAADNDA